MLYAIAMGQIKIPRNWAFSRKITSWYLVPLNHANNTCGALHYHSTEISSQYHIPPPSTAACLLRDSNERLTSLQTGRRDDVIVTWAHDVTSGASRAAVGISVLWSMMSWRCDDDVPAGTRGSRRGRRPADVSVTLSTTHIIDTMSRRDCSISHQI